MEIEAEALLREMGDAPPSEETTAALEGEEEDAKAKRIADAKAAYAKRKEAAKKSLGSVQKKTKKCL